MINPVMAEGSGFSRSPMVVQESHCSTIDWLLLTKLRFQLSTFSA
jgi:hypothetical protein